MTRVARRDAAIRAAEEGNMVFDNIIWWVVAVVARKKIVLGGVGNKKKSV